MTNMGEKRMGVSVVEVVAIPARGDDLEDDEAGGVHFCLRLDKVNSLRSLVAWKELGP